MAWGPPMSADPLMSLEDVILRLLPRTLHYYLQVIQ